MKDPDYSDYIWYITIALSVVFGFLAVHKPSDEPGVAFNGDDWKVKLTGGILLVIYAYWIYKMQSWVMAVLWFIFAMAYLKYCLLQWPGDSKDDTVS